MEQTILLAAERLFLEKGFAMTSTTEIAKEAGCNQALIHYYFRTKEKLFEAIFEDKLKIFFSDFVQISESASTFEDGLRRTIEAHFDMIRSHPRLPFLIVNELSTNPARIDSLKARFLPIVGNVYTRVEAWLEDEISKGTIRPISAFDLMITIVSLNASLFIAAPILRQVRGMSDEELERFLDWRRKEVVIMVTRSLRP
jgi:AcrR family transcriptional regulator